MNANISILDITLVYSNQCFDMPSQYFSYQTLTVRLRDLLETLSKSSEEPQRVGGREAVAQATTALPQWAEIQK